MREGKLIADITEPVKVVSAAVTNLITVRTITHAICLEAVLNVHHKRAHGKYVYSTLASIRERKGNSERRNSLRKEKKKQYA